MGIFPRNSTIVLLWSALFCVINGKYIHSDSTPESSVQDMNTTVINGKDILPNSTPDSSVQDMDTTLDSSVSPISDPSACPICISSSPINLSAHDILTILFNTTNGSKWLNSEKKSVNWGGADECKFSGVRCEDGVVVEIFLRKHGLAGSIPSQLGQLSGLQTLNLAENTLTGSIPCQLGQLNSLQFLALTENTLTGSIPCQLGQLSSVWGFFLGNNSFTGSIPNEVCELDIKYYDFTCPDNNPSSGPSVLESLTPSLSASTTPSATPSSLRSREPSSAPIVVPTDSPIGAPSSGPCAPSSPTISARDILAILFDTTNGSEWDNSENWGSANECDYFGVACRNGVVIIIHLEKNGLTGSIPSQLGQLIGLQMLDISTNKLTGSIPCQLGELSDLQSMRLDDNQFTGTIPNQLGHLSDLKLLTLRYNDLSGSTPNEVCELDLLISNGIICF